MAAEYGRQANGEGTDATPSSDGSCIGSNPGNGANDGLSNTRSDGFVYHKVGEHPGTTGTSCAALLSPIGMLDARSSAYAHRLARWTPSPGLQSSTTSRCAAAATGCVLVPDGRLLGAGRLHSSQFSALCDAAGWHHSISCVSAVLLSAGCAAMCAWLDK